MQFPAISPKASIYLNAVPGLFAVLAMMTPSMFPSYISAGVTADIIQTAGFVTALWTGMNAYLHSVSSTAPGPMTAQDPTPKS
jgi:hypothetical protein